MAELLVRSGDASVRQALESLVIIARLQALNRDVSKGNRNHAGVESESEKNYIR